MRDWLSGRVSGRRAPPAGGPGHLSLSTCLGAGREAEGRRGGGEARAPRSRSRAHLPARCAAPAVSSPGEMQPTFFTWLRTQPKSPGGRRVRRDAQCLLKREENESDGDGEPFLPRLRLSAEPWGSRRESAVISKTSLRKLHFPVRFYYLRQNRCWLDSVLESSCTGWVLLSRAQAAYTELGYPESLIQHLRYFFLWVTPEDIHKWNVTSLETVKSLLKVSKGHGMDAQVAALIARYVVGGGQLDKATLDTLATFPTTYLCLLSPEQLGFMQLNVVWVTRPQDLDTCSPWQMAVLYPKARIAFQNMSRSEYFTRIKTYLEDSSGGPHLLRLGPGPVLTVTPSRLLALILN
ncbi:mesothelin isoform X2 [Phocoena sinus]|uniref:mesothelin isoform X2 n=1 Tax=Phocoena sinus TaxID=42100 RepID=UPI0013C466F5|nr:mesothelin isoform X2 [Phocoena sinus]